jgi:hypothetical protein
MSPAVSCDEPAESAIEERWAGRLRSVGLAVAGHDSRAIKSRCPRRPGHDQVDDERDQDGASHVSEKSLPTNGFELERDPSGRPAEFARSFNFALHGFFPRMGLSFVAISRARSAIRRSTPAFFMASFRAAPGDMLRASSIARSALSSKFVFEPDIPLFMGVPQMPRMKFEKPSRNKEQLF